jgi:hypothetical protein
MQATVVVFVVLAVAAGAFGAAVNREKRASCDCPNWGSGNVRLRNQEARIARLAATVARIEALADEKLGDDTHDVITELENMLNDVDGGTCSGGDFACGGSSNKCVSSLQVCDGVVDCESGHDEADSTCRTPAAVGSVWSGGRVYDDCTNRKPYEIQVRFTDSKRLDWFQARNNMRATVILKSKNGANSATASLPTSGYYNYASRKIYFNPPESDRLGLELDFNTGDVDSVNCYITRESTNDRCALFVLQRN